MRRVPRWILLGVACLAPVSAAGQRGAAPPDGQGRLTFRSAANYVEVDAIVTDAAGLPVKGLTASDFQVLEDGRAQPVSVFSFVDLPIERPDPLIHRETQVEPDVATNETAFDGRVFMIVLDGFHVATARSAPVRRQARTFVERHMGENDFASVVHIGNPGAGQEFTSNKRLLLQAIDRFTAQGLRSETASRISDARLTQNLINVPPQDLDASMREFLALESLESVRRVAEYMGGLTGRRKALLLFSEGISIEILAPPIRIATATTTPVDPGPVRAAQTRMIAEATRSNVSLYPIDPRGLAVAGEDAISIGSVPVQMAEAPGFSITGSLQREQDLAQDSLRTFADRTGGFAVIHQNDVSLSFDRIIKENSSYYLLGYQSPDRARNGRFHRVSVRVLRPGLRVRTRDGYYAPDDRVRPAPATLDPVREILQSPTPIAGLPMRATASVVRGGIMGHVVHLTVEVSGRDLALRPEAGVFLNEVDFEFAALDMRGAPRAAGKGTLHLRLLPATERGFANRSVRYITEFDLQPGRYQVRIAAREQEGGQRGSLFCDLDVPDFDRLPLSMSDLLLTTSSAALSPTVRERAALERGMPGPTSTARDFTASDTLTAFLWLYAGHAVPAHTVDLQWSIRSDRGNEVFRRDEVLTSAALDLTREGYGARLSLPLGPLGPGRYVLAVSARSRLSGEIVRKEIEFRLFAAGL
jgi:VWFA-related protein